MPEKPRSFIVINYTASSEAGPDNPFFLGQVEATPDKSGSVSVKLLSLKTEINKIVAGGVAVESDPVALAKLATTTTELKDAIALRPTSDALKVALDALVAEIAALDALKADKAAQDAANQAIADLSTLLADNTASDAQLKAQIKAVEDAIANAKPDVLTPEQKAVLASLKLKTNLGEVWSAGALPNFGGVQAIAPAFAVDASAAIATPTYELPSPGNNFLDINVPTTVGKTYRLVFGSIGTATGNVILRSNNNAANFSFTAPNYSEVYPGITVTRSGSMFVFAYQFVADAASFVSRITTGCPYNQGPALLEVGDTALYEIVDGVDKRILTDADISKSAFPSTLQEVLGQAFTLSPNQSATFSPRSGVENAISFPGQVSFSTAQNQWLRVIFDAPVRYVWILAQKSASDGAAVSMNMRNSASQNVKSFANLRGIFLWEEPKWVLFDYGRVVERGSRILLSCSNAATNWFRVFDVQGYTEASVAAAPATQGVTQILNIDRDFIDADFDSNDWVQANQILKDYIAWTMKTQLYLRVARRVVKPMFPDTTEPLPPATHNTAIEVTPGVFENRMPGGTSIRYSSPKTATSPDDLVTFQAGRYSHFQWILVDAAGARVGSYGSNKAVLQASFTGQTVSYTLPNPAGVAAIRVILTRAADHVEETYDVPAT